MLEGIKKFFGFKEKREHYSDIAKGKKGVVDSDYYSPSQQISYARGQKDARDEFSRYYAWKNATPEQREAHKQEQKRKRDEWKANNQ